MVGLILVGGHIQTGAHVLLAGGLFALWRAATCVLARGAIEAEPASLDDGDRSGLADLAAVQIVPLGYYLARSPVWGDRQRETKAWWTLSRPRLLDAVCTALPYAYGSQRRGHPNLARGLGVHNLNESAGGYAGLATLIWLAPLALRDRGRRPEVGFLAVLVVVGALGAFRLPPVDNLPPGSSGARRDRQPAAHALGGLRPEPAGRLRDRRSGARSDCRPDRGSPPGWSCAGLAGGIACRDSSLRAAAPRARRAPLSEARSRGRGSRSRRDRGQGRSVRFARRSSSCRATTAWRRLSLRCLAVLAMAARRRPRLGKPACLPLVLGLTLVELAGFGFGLNPAIAS